MSETFHFSAEENDKDVRLDQFLGEKSEFSRSFVRKCVKNGHVKVNNKVVVKPAHALKEGDDVRLTIPEPESPDLEAEDHDLKIYYEDEYLVVVEKPAGMVVHPTPKRKTGTLVNALLAHFQNNLSDQSGALRPGIVHRLDEDTSGLLIVAKTNQAHSALGELFQKRKIKKTYVSLLAGVLEPTKGSIEAPMSRGTDVTRMVISPAKKAKHALTHYKVLGYPENKYSLVDVEIVTGRTHQIRVHFRAIGHPVAGDPKYGFANINEELKKKFGLTRQFLHAKRLAFTHPFTGEKLVFESPLPEDLQEVLNGIRFSKT